MYIWICVYIWIYVYIYIHMYICICVCIYVRHLLSLTQRPALGAGRCLAPCRRLHGAATATHSRAPGANTGETPALRSTLAFVCCLSAPSLPERFSRSDHVSPPAARGVGGATSWYEQTPRLCGCDNMHIRIYTSGTSIHALT